MAAHSDVQPGRAFTQSFQLCGAHSLRSFAPAKLHGRVGVNFRLASAAAFAENRSLFMLMKTPFLFFLAASSIVFATQGFAAESANNAPAPADEVKFAGLPPEQAAKEMTVPAGFKAILFAGEPDVKQPIAFAIDDRGRLWVAEAYTYPRRAPEGQGKDRVLIFEDTDGDGKFDKRTIFIEGLNLVSGLAVGFGGVYVGAAPYLMFIPDRNHDDVPDSKPEILLDGFAYQDTHETLNTFTWGPDGWLYGCHGVFTYSNVGKPGA